MNSSLSFAPRECPNCGGSNVKRVVSLTANEIVQRNWSYKSNCLDILELEGDSEFEISRCIYCKFLYAPKLPSREFLARLYDQVICLDSVAGLSQSRMDSSRRFKYLSTLVNLIGESTKVRRILDYGAGFGQSASALSSQGFDMVVFEGSEKRVSDLVAQSRKVASCHEEIKELGPYSAVICDNVLEHVPDPRSLVTYFRELLCSNGVLFLSVPSYENYALQKIVESKHMSLNPWEHLNYFDLSHLDYMLSTSGFVAIQSDKLGGEVAIGLRSEERLPVRMLNGFSSSIRLIKYVLTGFGVQNVNCRFYRPV